MESRGIEEDHLPFFDMFNAENPVSCGLGFFSDDGNLLAQDAIEKSRFSDIGPSQNGDETGLKRDHDLGKASSEQLVRSFELRILITPNSLPARSRFGEGRYTPNSELRSLRRGGSDQ